MRKRGKLAAFLCGLCLICCPVSAHSQDSHTPREPLDTLKEALPFVRWDKSAHGPLIAIDPASAHWQNPANGRAIDPRDGDAGVSPDVAAVELYSPQDRYGLSADVVARHFSRKLVRFPTLAIVVPSTMYLLNTDLKPADPSVDAPLTERMLRFQMSLTLAQWQTFGNAGGIGRDDLKSEQQPLFDDLLPENVKVEKTDGTGAFHPNAADETPQPLTEVQRQGLRVRLTRRAQFSLVDTESSPVGTTLTSPQNAPGMPHFYFVYPSPRSESASVVFGQPIRLVAPNRLKPSDLDFKQPLLQDKWIALGDAKTVGDLLKAVRTSTGLEIYADDRLARLELYLSADDRPVHAADLLEALCWALAATYRKIGPAVGDTNPNDCAYVLTYDRIGLTALRGTIAEWAGRGKALQASDQQRFNEAAEKVKVGPYAHFADSYALEPTPEALAALHAAALQAKAAPVEVAEGIQPWHELTVPVSTLSTWQRQQMQQEIETYEEQHPSTAETDLPGQRRAPLNKSRIGLGIGVGISFLLPDMGEIDASNFSFSAELPGDEPPAKPIETAADLKREAEQAKSTAKFVADLKSGPTDCSPVIVCIAPKNLAEAGPIIQAAHGCGVHEIWIATRDIESDRQLLSACVALGKANEVAIGARIGLVYIDPSDQESTIGQEDVNVYSETGVQFAAHYRHAIAGIDKEDVYPFAEEPPDGRGRIAPESAAARKQILQRVRAIASLPGLAAVVLYEAAGPGRDWTTDRVFESLTGRAFGYTVENRLAFLRRFGYDPVDLEIDASNFDSGNLREAVELPRFDRLGTDTISDFFDGHADLADVQKEWFRLCGSESGQMLGAIRADLYHSVPTLQVYLGDSHSDFAYGRYQLWNDLPHIPFTESSAATPSALKQIQGANRELKPSRVLYESLPVDSDFGAGQRKWLKILGVDDATIREIPEANFLSQRIRGILRREPGLPGWPQPNGVLLDLTRLPASDIPLLLKATLRPAAQ